MVDSAIGDQRRHRIIIHDACRRDFPNLLCIILQFLSGHHPAEVVRRCEFVHLHEQGPLGRLKVCGGSHLEKKSDRDRRISTISQIHRQGPACGHPKRSHSCNMIPQFLRPLPNCPNCVFDFFVHLINGHIFSVHLQGVIHGSSNVPLCGIVSAPCFTVSF